MAFTPILVNATDAVRAYAFAAVEATPRQSVIATYAGMAGYDARATLAQYPGPTLSIAAAALDEPMRCTTPFRSGLR